MMSRKAKRGDGGVASAKWRGVTTGGALRRDRQAQAQRRENMLCAFCADICVANAARSCSKKRMVLSEHDIEQSRAMVGENAALAAAASPAITYPAELRHIGRAWRQVSA